MIALIIKDSKTPYSTSCLGETALEKLILSSDPEDNFKAEKKLCKEFNVTPEQLIKYWVVKD
jgi:hypothetical protein